MNKNNELSERGEVTINIGNLIGQAANASAESWDYAAFMFNAKKKGGSSYLFSEENRLSLETINIRKDLRTNFLRLREITRVDGDDYWIKCLASVRNRDKQLKLLFEFEDTSRWEITPENVREAFQIIIGDIFSEDFE